MSIRNALASGNGGGVLLTASAASPSADAFVVTVVIDGVAFENTVAAQQSSGGDGLAVGGAIAVIVPDSVTSTAFDVIVRHCSFRNTAAVARTWRCSPLRPHVGVPSVTRWL
jgi:hypothetical protein